MRQCVIAVMIAGLLMVLPAQAQQENSVNDPESAVRQAWTTFTGYRSMSISRSPYQAGLGYFHSIEHLDTLGLDGDEQSERVWRVFFESALVIPIWEATPPTAVFYNPVLDVAMLGTLHQESGRFDRLELLSRSGLLKMFGVEPQVADTSRQPTAGTIVQHRGAEVQAALSGSGAGPQSGPIGESDTANVLEVLRERSEAVLGGRVSLLTSPEMTAVASQARILLEAIRQLSLPDSMKGVGETLQPILNTLGASGPAGLRMVVALQQDEAVTLFFQNPQQPQWFIEAVFRSSDGQLAAVHFLTFVAPETSEAG